MKGSLKLLFRIVLLIFVFANIVVIFHAYKLTHFMKEQKF